MSKQYWTPAVQSLLYQINTHRELTPQDRELKNAANYTDFNGNAVKLTGDFETDTRYGDKSLTATWKVVEGSKEPLMGITSQNWT